MARILVLEDDAQVSAVYTTSLKRAGHEIVSCRRFEDARTELRNSVPDALLTDVRVGQYNGLQIALLFRSLSPDGPIVVVSGHDDAVIRKEVGVLQGDFLLKPVDLSVLTAHFQ